MHWRPCGHSIACGKHPGSAGAWATRCASLILLLRDRKHHLDINELTVPRNPAGTRISTDALLRIGRSTTKRIWRVSNNDRCIRYHLVQQHVSCPIRGELPGGIQHLFEAAMKRRRTHGRSGPRPPATKPFTSLGVDQRIRARSCFPAGSDAGRSFCVMLESLVVLCAAVRITPFSK
jgi:hypothetical protein